MPPPSSPAPPLAEPIADALVVTACAYHSLQRSRDEGMLQREWAMYALLGTAGMYGRIILVTYGGAEDQAIARTLGPLTPQVICNTESLDTPQFLADVSARIAGALASARSVIVKTEQMWGGRVALDIAATLRAAGKRVGLIARGGYPWSRFVTAESGPASPQAAEAALFEGDLCRGADVVVGTTRDMLDALAWRYALAPEHTRLIPNYLWGGLTDRPIVPASERDPATILFAGRLQPQKRVDLLIDAVAQLTRATPPAGKNTTPRPRLHIIGQGPLEASLKAQAAAAGIDAVFEPRIPHADLLDRMARCTLYAQTSAYEGHPKTVLEAMATGAPVVVTNAPGLTDAVRHHETGLVAPPDAAAISGALALLLHDRAARERLGRAAALHVRQHLSLDAILPLELAAHRAAIARAGANAPAPAGAVRWTPDLLAADSAPAVDAWANSLGAYVKRLDPPRAARFIMSLDPRIDQIQNLAAMRVGDGVHPKHHLMRYHDFFIERISPGQRIIDLGCGYGAVARSIAARSHAHVTGIDWSESNIAQARATAARDNLTPLTRFVHGDITSHRVRNNGDAEGGFDAVVLSNVLEHITDRPARLRLWLDWYHPAKFLIRVPAIDRNWKVAWMQELGVDHRVDPTHETEYTIDQMRAELAAAGLTMTETIARWGEYWLTAVPVAEAV